MMIIAPIIVAVAAAVAAGALLYKPQQVMAINGVECHALEQTNYHVHSHLDVFVDGQKHQVPSKIGILSSPSCLYWLHTHDTDGIIHVEAPQPRDFTLGQFLNIWNQTKETDGFFSSVSDMNVTAYVDGKKIGDYKDIKLESLKEIVIAYGKPPSSIPEKFDFATKGLRD